MSRAPKLAGRAFAAAWAMGLGLALASCLVDVSLGVGGDGVGGGEVCGDRIDNNGNNLIDEGCDPGPDRNCLLPMDARAYGSCERLLGFAWNGKTCVELRGCTCLGSRCGALYDTGPGCAVDKMLCMNPGVDPEICGDGIDNDGDLLVDEDCPVPCPALLKDLAGMAPPSPDCADKLLGYAWDGKSCSEIRGCACEGPACQALTPDLASCQEKNSRCLPFDCQAPVPVPPAPDGSGNGAGSPPINYESFDPAQCEKLGAFPCGPGFEFFSNECGCGCVGYPTPTPDPPFSIRLHASYDAAECDQRKVSCSAGQTQIDNFFDESGCGCLYKTECPDPTAPGVELKDDPRACDDPNFGCKVPEQVAFRGPCGCGCMPAPPGLCSMPPDAYTVTDPYLCSIKPIGCPTNSRPFRDFCGCGCLPLDEPNNCPDPNAPGVDYLDATPENFSICKLISFACGPGQQPFIDPACGCGCAPFTDEPQPQPSPPPPGP